jgi:hypothetical protein
MSSLIFGYRHKWHKCYDINYNMVTVTIDSISVTGHYQDSSKKSDFVHWLAEYMIWVSIKKLKKNDSVFEYHYLIITC